MIQIRILCKTYSWLPFNNGVWINLAVTVLSLLLIHSESVLAQGSNTSDHPITTQPKGGDTITIKGESMTYDTKKDITTATSQNGFATVDVDTGDLSIHIKAKNITAKIDKESSKNTSEQKQHKKKTHSLMANSSSFAKGIETISASGHISIVWNPKPIRQTSAKTLYADTCSSKGKTLLCKGHISLHSNQNIVSGDEGIFNFENGHFEINATNSDVVTAVIMPHQTQDLSN